MRFFLLFFLAAFFPAQAKVFQNSYVSFDIAETWECKALGTDWVCHSKFQEKKVEALITTTAKIVGPGDTLDQYLAYLQQPKTWSNAKKEEITSIKMTQAKRVFINKFPWIDGIHKNSEVKSYISRYAATVCCKDSSAQLGILLVLSAHQDHYTKYSGSFVKTINSLRVLDIEKAIPKIRAAQAQGGEGMSNYLEGLFDEGGSSAEADSPGFLGLKPVEWGVAGGIPLAGALSYFFLKRRKKGRRSRRRSRRRR